MIDLLALTVLTASSEWFAIRVTTVDSTSAIVHDVRSGLYASYSTSTPALDEAQLLAHSDRLANRQSGKLGATSWELFELSDPGADAKGLLRDFGQQPLPGSWEAALIESTTPPPTCPRELNFVVTKQGQRVALLQAVPCSEEQRTRAFELMQVYATGSGPAELGERRPFDSSSVKEEDIDWLESSPTAGAVLARCGVPFQVFPRYPDGVTFVYYVGGTDLNLSVAIDFDRGLTARDVRMLSATIWSDPPRLAIPPRPPNP